MAECKDLSYLLFDNLLLQEFQGASDLAINNFLHNGVFLEGYKKLHIESVDYLFIDTRYIKYLIQIDEVLRASVNWNNEPLTVYRGTLAIDENSFCGLVSTTLDINVATGFYTDALVKIELPAGFPHIKMFNVSKNLLLNSEKEIVLPPCDFEILNKTTFTHQDNFEQQAKDYDYYEIKLTPKNLAECFLERMKNPPKDYLLGASERDKRQYKKAMELLKDYVENYVKTGTFKYLVNLNESFRDFSE